MKSRPYEKTPGGGGLTAFPAPSDPPSVSSPQAPAPDVCTYVNAKGGRCRMLIVHPGADLCPDHFDKYIRAEVRRAQTVSANLLEDMHDFSTPTSVNIFLGNLLREFTLKRIDRKDALAMAYIGQMLLNSHADLDRFHKYGFNEKNTTAALLLQRKHELELSLIPRPAPNPAQSPTQNKAATSSPTTAGSDPKNAAPSTGSPPADGGL